VTSVWPLHHKGLIGGVLQRWLSFWKVLPARSVWQGLVLPIKHRHVRS
jgi:hypothetical protein